MGAVLDVLTTVDGTQATPFDNSVESDVILGNHYWSINGDNPIVAGTDATGTFSSVQWVVASPSAISDWLTGEGFTPQDIQTIEATQMFVDLIAANDNGSGSQVIGLSEAEFPIPEPSAISILLLAGSALIIGRKRS